MGRPKLYEDEAERMRAYRARRKERTFEVDKISFVDTETSLRRLLRAVVAAADVDAGLAAQVNTVTVQDMLEGLTALFEDWRAVALVARAAAAPAVEPQEQASSGAGVAVPPPSSGGSSAPSRKPVKLQKQGRRR